MFELLSNFVLGCLSPDSTEITTPLGRMENRTPQRDDLPDELQIDHAPPAEAD